MTKNEIERAATSKPGRLRPSSPRWLPLALTAAVALTASTTVLLSTAVAQERPLIDPIADFVLRQSSAYLASLGTFVVSADILEDDWTDTGQLVEFSRSVELAVRRPDRMWVDAYGDAGHKRYWYDGSAVTLLDYGSGTYAQTAVPGTLDEALETVAERFDVHVPLADLAFSDLYTALMGNVTSATYVGLRAIDGVEYHHLAFSQESIDWQLWIENGQRPLPARMVITYKNEEGSPRFSAALHWHATSPLPDTLFTFAPPPGTREIEMVAPSRARQ